MLQIASQSLTIVGATAPGGHQVQIPNAETITLVTAQECGDWNRIVGLFNADQDVTVNVLQGSGLDDSAMEFAEPTSVTGSGTALDFIAGAGAQINSNVRGRRVRIDINNASGHVANVRCFVALKGI